MNLNNNKNKKPITYFDKKENDKKALIFQNDFQVPLVL